MSEWAYQAVRSSKNDAIEKWMSGAWTQAQFEAYVQLHREVFPGSDMKWSNPLSEEGLAAYDELRAEFQIS